CANRQHHLRQASRARPSVKQSAKRKPNRLVSRQCGASQDARRSNTLSARAIAGGLGGTAIARSRRGSRRGPSAGCAAPGRPRHQERTGRRNMSLVRRLWDGESGQDLIEYALLAALLAVVTIMALQGLGISVAGFYKKLNDKMATM